ncbi:putative spermidine/putrescine transport system permease protein [Tistlia consotensis]|uniref:Putative spermidine/putrescine transport system permease protein n=1 Tax=Tistlia consotensis USBA 355 TaxID=560819 RepID=A0A1Y6B2W9_9PROT|nr:ABC transporter permease [Tistlia consotensis]SME88693.1 putative spermidine/putrescine transport system permease protein [Tistlia consotensis USBA 355]SNR25254.1 putative spermidine/putrescine transport system permease protein [Tistlia consotensis]
MSVLTTLPSYASPIEKIWYVLFRVLCGCVFLFLIAPILIIIPLSFNAEPYFTFTHEMLTLHASAFSTRWYHLFLNDARWMQSVENSIIVAFFATLLATVLGTLAALGLSRSHMPARTFIMSVLISPMVVPLIITAAGIYFFYASVGLTGSLLGIILAHTALGTPFVVITVTATLIGFDQSLIRASAMLGANPATTFRKVIMPLILPGVISGALFAFVTSFDEVVVVLFIAPNPEQYTIPRQMWSGIREQISPAILAVATCLIVVSIALMTVLELLRRRSERLRGMTPQ